MLLLQTFAGSGCGECEEPRLIQPVPHIDVAHHKDHLADTLLHLAHAGVMREIQGKRVSKQAERAGLQQIGSMPCYDAHGLTY